MREIIVKSIMFISSYFPLYVFLAIQQFDAFLNIYNTIKTLEFNKINSFELFFCLIVIVFIAISILSIILLRDGDYYNLFCFKDIKRANDDVISYVFTYIIPILSFSLDKPSTLLVNCLLFLLIWFLYIRLSLIYLNPLWALFGYISYESDNGYIITDMLMNEIKRRKDKQLNGYYLTNGVFVAKRKYNQI